MGRITYRPCASLKRKNLELTNSIRMDILARIRKNSLQLNTPPSSGPAIAEQLQVTLKAWDHFALLRTSTSSEVITQTELTIPPPPTPESARAAISHPKSWENITARSAIS
jgi:hypothetical protein